MIGKVNDNEGGLLGRVKVGVVLPSLNRETITCVLYLYDFAK